MILKICDNLHIIDEAIISYSTVVGRVTPTGIEANGKYSRSTTKHVGRISQMLGIPIEYVTMDKQWFAWYDYGANVKYDGAIGQASTSKILAKALETGTSLIEAAILALPEITGKDRQRCIDQLLNEGVDSQKIDDIVFLNHLGLM
jgi:hypothetical protein